MAALTGTTFKDFIIHYGGDEVAEIGDNADQFLIWVNMALVNRHEDVCVLYNKYTSDNFTFSTKGYEYDLPTDWDGVSTISLYTDSDMHVDYDSWDEEFGKHRFYGEQSASATYYRRYRTQPSEYDAMTDSILETINPRTRKILTEEIIAMYLASQNDLESSNAEQAALSKSNRNS